MKPRTASLLAVLLVASPAVAERAPELRSDTSRTGTTDCYLGLSQFYRAQSDFAADRALAQSDAAWYRAITGTDPPKP